MKSGGKTTEYRCAWRGKIKGCGKMEREKKVGVKKLKWEKYTKKGYINLVEKARMVGLQAKRWVSAKI